MTTIGTFTLTKDGSFTGEIATLTIRRKAKLVPTEATGTNAPELRVFSGPAEIGVAWRKSSKGGESYFAVRLDEPSFPATIWANLVESQREAGTHNLLWDRPRSGKVE